MEDIAEISTLKPGFSFTFRNLSWIGTLSIKNTKRLGSKLASLLGILLLTLATLFNMADAEDFRSFVERFSFFLGCCVFIVKIVNFKVNEGVIVKTVKALGDLKFSEDQHLVETYTRCQSLAKLFIIGAVGFVLYANLYTVFVDGRLIVPLFSGTEAFLYIGLLYELIQTVVASIMSVSVDTIHYSILYVFEAHLTCISRKFQEITPSKNQREEMENAEKLKEIIGDYNAIVRVFNMICESFMFANFCTKCILEFLICTLAFQMSNVNLQSEPFLFMKSFLFLLFELSDLSIPHYFADRVTQQSSKLMTDCFQCSWIEQSLEFKKLILMFSTKLNEPLKFRIFICEWSLEEFVRVCNALYSFYTVLKQF